jgi:predicted nucleic acid-binding protein
MRTEGDGLLAGLLVDTNVVYATRRHTELFRLARQADVPMYVSAITHGERLRQLRVRHGDRYDPAIVSGGFDRLGIRGVLPVDERVADVFAQRIAGRFPTKNEWDRQKQAHCLAMLHLAHTIALDEISTHARCSGTADWFIAATAATHNLLMVTEDPELEFEICDSVNVRQAVEMLRAHAPQE